MLRRRRCQPSMNHDRTTSTDPCIINRRLDTMISSSEPALATRKTTRMSSLMISTRRATTMSGSLLLLLLIIALISNTPSSSSYVEAYNYNNYYNNQNQNQNYYNNYNNYNNNNENYNYQYQNQNNNNDDGNSNYNNKNDDANAANNDDANNAAADDDAYVAGNDDDANNNNNNANNDDDFDADKYAQDYDAALEDDYFHWDSNLGFDGVSIMPVSCINYNNGHMIKFSMFETENSYQCHFAEIGIFVVSIAHYMRAYFNHEALVNGKNFKLPSDAGFLNCILLEDHVENINTNIKLYGKIGCMERETFTSTKLQIHIYTDAQCSVPYDDGNTARFHASRGYMLQTSSNDNTNEEFLFTTKVSFRPPFYTCQSCNVEQISDTFNKQSGNWYDDDYISQNGQKNKQNQNNNQQQQNDDAQNNDDNQNANNDDANQANNDDGGGNNNYNYKNNYYDDDGGGYVDDTYMSANDDIYKYNNNNNNYYNNNNYQYNGNNRRELISSSSLLRSEAEFNVRFFTPVPGQLQKFEEEFWRDVEYQKKQRELYENQYSIDDWNMCQQVYKYGLYCDEQCRSLDAFRTDRWSGADIILLSIMCTFMAAMMLLIVAKRLKASQKQRLSLYQYHEQDTEVDSKSMPGLPPVAMFAIFSSVMIIIVVLAELKFVNETLVFAVVTCVLLFIYMLKLTLFAKRKPVLLAAPKHDMFDNPLDERLFT